MNNVTWHKISEFDLPDPWKDILIVDNNGHFFIGYYEGESSVYPWYNYYMGMRTKGKNYVAWCELPSLPSYLEVVLG